MAVAGGLHLLVDLWVDDPTPLRRAATWERLLPAACTEAGATVLGATFHQFEPEGVTGVVLLAESHASVHTWPERGLATLDVFTCGALDAEAVVERVRAAIDPVQERVTVVARGEVAEPASGTASATRPEATRPEVACNPVRSEPRTLPPPPHASPCPPERAERAEGSPPDAAVPEAVHARDPSLRSG